MKPVTEYLEKSNFTSGTDLTNNGGLLSPEQAQAFIQVMIADSPLIRDCRNETNTATKFEVTRLSFASRILKAGSEGTRPSNVLPTTGLVTLSTNLFRGEVPFTDETFEDNIEGEGLADSIMTMMAQAVSRDVEEIGIKNDTARVGGDSEPAEFDVFSGLVKQLQGTTGAQLISDASSYTSFDSLFGKLWEILPSQYKRSKSALRYYTSQTLSDRYRQSLGQRGTALGDEALKLGTDLKYNGIPVVPVPMLTGTSTINSVSTPYDQMVFLTDPKNIVWGWHRKIRIEKWREPREGVTYFIPTVRFDVKIAEPGFVTFAQKASAL